MTNEEFETAAIMELASQDTLALMRAIQDGTGLIADGAGEIGRWMKAREAFPGMTLLQMWATDRDLSGQKRGRPTSSDLQRVMLDPAWLAVIDLERLKTLWRELRPTEQVPVEFLTDIVVSYRDVDRSAVVARRNRPKSRRITKS